jgi:transposase
MQVIHRCCAGLDIHKDTVVACVRRVDDAGRARAQVRTFGAMTGQLIEPADWLAEQGVRHLAMESTGVYWKPVWHLLEGRFEPMLVNAQHIKQVPGRKTDVKDCQWIAELLQHGLLRPSFVPPEPIRELRDLTRQRAQVVAERGSVANRIQGVLEDANVKLGSVATDVLGDSGRAMLRAMIGGQDDPGALAELAQGRLRAKIPALRLALRGKVTEHHRFLLRVLLDHYEALEALIGRLGERIDRVLTPYAEAAARLETIPGVGRRVAEIIVAELGAEMGQFPSARHLASWAGMCPGNNESAGKRRSGKTTKGSRWLRTALIQAAHAAGRSKATYLGSLYRRLSARRGRKRAAVAVGHTLLGIIYQVLKTGSIDQDLGPEYLERLEPERMTRQLVRRLERLGHKVTLEAKDEAA